MRLVAALQGRLDDEMAKEARAVGRAVEKAVVSTTNETKAIARAHVASRLGRRAGFLVTSRIYQNQGLNSTGLLYSRWKRKSSGVDVVNFATNAQNAGGVGRSSGFADVLGAFNTGATIRPRDSKFLYVPVTRGRLSRTRRRIFQEGVGKGNVDLIPFQDKYGNLAYAVTERRRRGEGRLIAYLFQQIKVPKKLNLEPIYAAAGKKLATRLVAELNRQAA